MGAFPDMKCRMPDFNAPIHLNMTNRKFSVYSSPVGGGAGIGNILTYWPNAWVLAAVTGYDIVIVEDSLVGKLCAIIQCGHVNMSTVKMHYDYVKRKPRILQHTDILKILSGKKMLTEDVVMVSGYLTHHSADLYNEAVRQCLSSLTGCPGGDALCMEQFAFQTLIKGPFHPHAAAALQDRVVGLPPILLKHILHRPLSLLPRLDGAFQLRMQYGDMENNRERDAFKSFFTTTDGGKVVAQSTAALRDYFINPKSPFKLRPYNRSHAFIYVSCDDSVDKLKFAELLLEKGNRKGKVNVSAVYVRNVANMSHTKSYAHKNFEKFEQSVTYYSLVDTVFDWYMLALSNIIWSYRNAHIVSTFTESAARVTDRDVCDYSTYGKVRVMSSPHGNFKPIWMLSHPKSGNISCSLPPHSAHAFSHHRVAADEAEV